MKTLKKLIWAICIGGLSGAFLFAWFSPDLIEWYFSSPVDLAINCKPVMQWAIVSYRKAILVGMIVGSLTSTAIFFAFTGRGKVPPTQPNEPESGI